MTGSAAFDSSGTPPRQAGVVRSTDEDRWQAAFLTHMDPFALLEVVRDADGTPCDLMYIDVNPAACAYHGLTRDELVGETMLHLYPGLGPAGYMDAYLAAAAGGPPLTWDAMPYANEAYGEERWYDVRGVPCGDGLALTWRDVTDRHRLEQRLAEESHRFQLLLTSLYDVVVYSVDGVVRWISPAVEALLGYTADELMGTSTTHLWDPTDLERAVALRDAAAAGQDGLAELRIRHRDGRTLWVEVAVSQHTDPTGAVGIVASIRDITDRVEAEQALERRETEYRLLAENAEDIVVRGGPDGIFEWLSPSVSTVLGWAPDEWVGRPVPDLLHPDDRPQVLAALAATAQGEAASYEARFRRADGGVTWLSVRARPVFDAEGRLIGRVATARNIEAERAVREDRDAFAARFRTAFENAGIGMAMLTEEGDFIAANAAMARMMGRDVAWFPGRPVGPCVHPDDRAEAMRDRDALWRGEAAIASRELRLLDSAGQVVWVRRTGTLVRDAAGRPDFVLLQIQDLTAERRALDRADALEFIDPLTGLHNRTWLLDHLDSTLAEDQRTGRRLAVVLADLDQFKVVNESLGHEVGDDLVRAAARRISEAAGSVDAVSRIGGDEFVVVLPDPADLADIEHRTALILAAVAAPITLAGHDVLPSACAGIAVSDDEATASSLIRDADAAMYQAKARGRGQWQFADPGLHEDAVLRLTVEAELRAAMATDIEVHYQPIVRLGDRSVRAHEALVRWRHPERGLVPPGDFLDVAEISGLLPALHQRIVEIVVADLVRGAMDNVSINVSGSVLAIPTWADDLVDALEAAGVSPARVSVEVTETAVLPALAGLEPGFRRLRESGIGVHLDDFGTGFSSIALLRDLPVTALKLDASFVRDLPSSDRAHSLAAGLGGLVERLGLTGVAEGIEDVAAVPVLQALGWEYGQGYLFGRPAPLPA